MSDDTTWTRAPAGSAHGAPDLRPLDEPRHEACNEYGEPLERDPLLAGRPYTGRHRTAVGDE